MREPSSKHVKDTNLGPQRPPRRGLTSLLAFEVDLAKKTLADSGDNTLVSNFFRTGGWKVSLSPLLYVPDQRTPDFYPPAHLKSMVLFRLKMNVEVVK